MDQHMCIFSGFDHELSWPPEKDISTFSAQVFETDIRLKSQGLSRSFEARQRVTFISRTAHSPNFSGQPSLP